MNLATANKRRTSGVCVLCGRRRILTREHIPPKLIFRAGTPGLITVPACSECNCGTSKDDEYLRLLLAMPDGASTLPQIRPLVDPLMRSFKRKQSQGFLRGILDAVEPISVMTKGGIYVCGPGLKVDRQRVERIIRKIVKGLFYHEFRFRFPNNCGMAIVPLTPMQMSLPAEEFHHFLGGVTSLLNSPLQNIGNGVFVYQYGKSPESRFQTVWVLVFGGFLAFHASTNILGRDPHFE